MFSFSNDIDTNTDDLLYSGEINEGKDQHYNCHVCRSIYRYQSTFIYYFEEQKEVSHINL